MTRKTKLSLLSAALIAGFLSACGGGGVASSKDGDHIPDVLQVVNIPTTSVHCPYDPADETANIGASGNLRADQASDFYIKAAAIPGINVEAKDIDWNWAVNGKDVDDAVLDGWEFEERPDDKDDFARIVHFQYTGSEKFKTVTINMRAARSNDPNHGIGGNECKLTISD